ncbi:hypothetical protein SAMN05216191_119106 [Paenibacillus jilunlii]|uniref:Uncharacterized protein n=1 Tax=Paenibacillus jilunlii TaxID=682956 RepID=A0A1G9WK07_9BACL|nr:hypothetical protein SAMN05216191_119106 [Paenibacillus jilunlii]
MRISKDKLRHVTSLTVEEINHVSSLCILLEGKTLTSIIVIIRVNLTP